MGVVPDKAWRSSAHALAQVIGLLAIQLLLLVAPLPLAVPGHPRCAMPVALLSPCAVCLFLAWGGVAMVPAVVATGLALAPAALVGHVLLVV
jgi:hypothetical protein